jgi:hypothetical protein
MNTTTIFIFTDGFFRRYLHYHSVGNLFTNEITDENALSVTFLSVIFCSLISPLVIKKNIITDGKNAQKKKLSASFRWYFSRQNTVCNSVGNYLKIY